MTEPVQLRLQFVPVGPRISVFIAARRTGLSVATIRRYCDEGRIPGAFKWHESGHWEIVESEFNAWHQQRTRIFRMGEQV